MTETLILTIWDREFSLPIDYDCYEGEKVTKKQKSALKSFLKHREWIDASKKNVEEFCKEKVQEDDENLKKNNIFSYIKPSFIYVKRNDNNPMVALMCNYRYDEEHGIAIVFDCNGKVTVGSQDIIL